MSPTPRLNEFLKRKQVSPNPASDQKKVRITQETIEEIREDGRVRIRDGYILATTGVKIDLKVGQVVPVAWNKEGQPVAVLGHNWRRAEFPQQPEAALGEIQSFSLIESDDGRPLALFTSSVQGNAAVDLGPLGVPTDLNIASGEIKARLCQNNVSKFAVLWSEELEVFQSENRLHILIVKLARSKGSPTFTPIEEEINTVQVSSKPVLLLKASQERKDTLDEDDVLLRTLSSTATIFSTWATQVFAAAGSNTCFGGTFSPTIYQMDINNGSIETVETSTETSEDVDFGINLENPPDDIFCIETNGVVDVFAFIDELREKKTTDEEDQFQFLQFLGPEEKIGFVRNDGAPIPAGPTPFGFVTIVGGNNAFGGPPVFVDITRSFENTREVSVTPFGPFGYTSFVTANLEVRDFREELYHKGPRLYLINLNKKTVDYRSVEKITIISWTKRLFPIFSYFFRAQFPNNPNFPNPDSEPFVMAQGNRSDNGFINLQILNGCVGPQTFGPFIEPCESIGEFTAFRCQFFPFRLFSGGDPTDFPGPGNEFDPPNPFLSQPFRNQFDAIESPGITENVQGLNLAWGNGAGDVDNEQFLLTPFIVGTFGGQLPILVNAGGIGSYPTLASQPVIGGQDDIPGEGDLPSFAPVFPQPILRQRDTTPEVRDRILIGLDDPDSSKRLLTEWNGLRTFDLKEFDSEAISILGINERLVLLNFDGKLFLLDRRKTEVFELPALGEPPVAQLAGSVLPTELRFYDIEKEQMLKFTKKPPDEGGGMTLTRTTELAAVSPQFLLLIPDRPYEMAEVFPLTLDTDGGPAI